MSKEEILEFKGKVTDILPNAMFKVALENGHEVLAHTAGRMRKNRIRVLAGDEVLVQGRANCRACYTVQNNRYAAEQQPC